MIGQDYRNLQELVPHLKDKIDNHFNSSKEVIIVNPKLDGRTNRLAVRPTSLYHRLRYLINKDPGNDFCDPDFSSRLAH